MDSIMDSSSLDCVDTHSTGITVKSYTPTRPITRLWPAVRAKPDINDPGMS
jgi:hypothetical protein